MVWERAKKKLFWPAACVYDKLCGAHKQQYRISFDISRCAGWQRETRRRVKTTTNLVPACWRTILMYVCLRPAFWLSRTLVSNLRKLEFANLSLPAVRPRAGASVCSQPEKLLRVAILSALLLLALYVPHTLHSFKKKQAEHTHCTRWGRQLIKVPGLNHNFMPHEILNLVYKVVGN